MVETASNAPSVPVAPTQRRSTWDYLSIGSFMAAGALAASTIANNIRAKFFHSFVEGYKESRTPFSSIVEKYNGGPGVLAVADATSDGLFDHAYTRYAAGELNFKAYRAEIKKLTRDYRNEIFDLLEKESNIPSRGVTGWTVGTYKRWKELGPGAWRDAALGFGAVTFVGLGTLAVLRHSKHTLDHIEKRLDGIQSPQESQASR